jgi:hypothetical protein
MKRTVAAIAITLTLLLCGCRISSPNAPRTAGPLASPSARQSAAPTGLSATPATSGEQTGILAVIPTVQPESAETPVAPDAKRTAGIPEAQSFQNYSSVAGHYDVQVPEGWTAEANGENIKFTRNYNGVKVEILHTSDPFSLQAITDKQVAELIRNGKAVTVKSISQISVKSGTAIRVEYEANSEADPSGRKVRLECRLYYFHTNGRLAILNLWGPVSADNENIWAQIPDTFVWRN